MTDSAKEPGDMQINMIFLHKEFFFFFLKTLFVKKQIRIRHTEFSYSILGIQRKYRTILLRRIHESSLVRLHVS